MARVPLLSAADPDSGESGKGKAKQECISHLMGSSTANNQQPLNCNFSELPMTSFKLTAYRASVMNYPTASSLVPPPPQMHTIIQIETIYNSIQTETSYKAALPLLACPERFSLLPLSI